MMHSLHRGLLYFFQ